MKTKEDIINHYLYKLAAETTTQAQQRLGRMRVKASGSLVSSLQASIENATENNIARAFIQFLTHGRYIDMKNLDTAVPVENLEQWIEQVGVDKFKRKFSTLRPNRKLPVVKKDAITAIAWAIKMGKVKKRKRRAWYAKKTWGSIYAIFEQMRIDLVDHYFAEQKNSLNERAPG